MKTLILVTGQHRSGTSATAGCLQRLGVYLGHHLMPPAHDNPKGFFEDVRVVEEHDAILAALGASWDRPYDVPEPGDWNPGVAIAAETSLLRIVQDFTARADLFAIKDPRASLFLPLWEHVCAREGVRLTVLIPQRLAVSVIQSLAYRQHWDYRHAEKVVNCYSQALYQGLPKDVPVAEIHFPDGLWRASAWEQVARQLGVELNIRDGMREIYTFLDFGLVHHG